MRTVKYPKTSYLPWSSSVDGKDNVLSDMSIFEGQRVIVSEKLDGENTSMYSNNIHARSRDSVNHPSRNWVKNFWGEIAHLIPMNIRICGENCYAKHSIHYTNLISYFYGFNAWKDNVCLDWDTTLDIFDSIGIIPVPILYDGVYNEQLIREISLDERKQEGYIVRLACEFTFDEFTKCLGKYVRTHHIQTDEHWMKKPIIPNMLETVAI